jgi:hypothetical protein
MSEYNFTITGTITLTPAGPTPGPVSGTCSILTFGCSAAPSNPPPPPPPPPEVISEQTAPIVITAAGSTYTLTSSMRFPGSGFYIAAPNVTLDLNGHTIYYGGSNTNANNEPRDSAHGVVSYISWHNTEISITGAATPLNAVIKNGSIVHEGTGAVAHGIYGFRGCNTTIQDMRIEVYGQDSQTIFFSYGEGDDSGTITLTDSVLICHANTSFNRHAGPGNVRAYTINATGNVLIGGNSGFVTRKNSVISGNVIRHDGHVTNGYAVWLYQGTGNDAHDNLVIPSNGRGMILNGGSNNDLYDNVILHLERPNTEFGEALNPPALRSRYDTSNNTYTGNVSLGIGGQAAGLTSASGLYLTEYGTGTASTYSGNTFTTILVGERDVNFYAQPMTFEAHGSSAQSLDIISDNVLRSNDVFMRVSGWDGNMLAAVPVVGATLNYVTGDTAKADFYAAVDAKLVEIGLQNNLDAIAAVAAMKTQVNGLITGVPLYHDRATWFVKMYSPTPIDGTFLDLVAGAGVNLDSYAYVLLYDGTISLKVGQTVPVLLSYGGSPLVSQPVTVTTSGGDSYTVTTNASGVVALPVVEFAFQKSYPEGSLVTKVLRTTLTIANSGHSSTASVSSLLTHKNDATPYGITLS